MRVWKLGDRRLDFPPAIGVGIVNVTDDSFFEGARSATPERAIVDGLALAESGFEIVDVGAVPAAPGAPVPVEREAERIVPVAAALARASVPVTVDTSRHEVVREVHRALDPGAPAILGVNDTSGGTDPQMLEQVGELGWGYVLMHVEGKPGAGRRPRVHRDPIEHLRRWFSERIESVLRYGVSEEQIALDPGFDFDLSVDDALEVVRRLDELHELGRPLFVALSRKDFLGAVMAGSWDARAPAGEREWPTAAATALAVAAGADMLRLHDRSALDALRTAAAACAHRGSVAGSHATVANE